MARIALALNWRSVSGVFCISRRWPRPPDPLCRRQTARREIGRLADSRQLTGLDLETIGLCPHEGDRARLLQVAPQDGPCIGDFIASQIGLSEVTRRRALSALEKAGLVDVVREPGKAPAAKLTPWSGLRTEER